MLFWSLCGSWGVLKPFWRFKLFQVCSPLKWNERLETWSADGSNCSELAKIPSRQPSIILLSSCFASDPKVYLIRPKTLLLERWLPISASLWSFTSDHRWLSDHLKHDKVALNRREAQVNYLCLPTVESDFARPRSLVTDQNEAEMDSQRSKRNVFRADKIDFGIRGEATRKKNYRWLPWGNFGEAEHFSGIYGASSSNRRPIKSPAFRFTLMESKPGKV